MLLYWKWIATPLIGAFIGYVTNWIAVKMLFRPRREIRLFGRRLPLTPGVIPKGKARLARAVGKAVEEQLLTKEVLEDVLLSEKTKSRVQSGLTDWMEKQKQSAETLKDSAVRVFSEESVEDFIETAEENVTEILFQKIVDMEPGKLIADKVLDVAREKLKESMFGMMIGGSFLETIAQQIEEKINEYVKENGRPVIEQMVWEESEKLQEKPVGELFVELEEYGIDLPSFVVKQYEAIVKEKLPAILDTLRLSEIVESRINAMDVAEVEELMLSIMKKELGAIVNLGALIGFLLGLVNVAILYI